MKIIYYCIDYDFQVYKKFFEPLIDEGNQDGFLHFRTGCCEHNTFADFLKLFKVLDMDDSFPTSRSV
jgi:hypothetical protein